MARYAASQFGWPRVANTLAWTSCIQQEALNSPLKIIQEKETPKCYKIAHKEIKNPEAKADQKRYLIFDKSILETKAQ